MGRTNKVEDVFKFIDMKGGDRNECWPWVGSLGGRDGRGYIQVNGTRYLAYRIVYELMVGKIPEGKVVRHRCDNQKCCNPYHLRIGTLSDNNRDAVVRNRLPNARFTMAEARQIRGLWNKGKGKKVADIARMYGVNHAIISRIVHNKMYLEHDDEGLETET